MTTGPGWYPDPTGDFRERWWDGAAWSVHVRTGRFTADAPVEETAVPTTEETVWSHGPHTLTTHAVWLPEGGRPLALPWWMVADVDLRVGMGRALAGTGDVVLVINYPGYTGPRERRMKAVPDADRIAALAFTWSRRHRRAAGYL